MVSTGVSTAVGKVDKSLTTVREILFADYESKAHSDPACHDTQFKALLNFMINEYLNMYKYPKNWVDIYKS